MINITATASGGKGSYGVINFSSFSDTPNFPIMNNVTASASGGTIRNNGVYNFNSSPTMSNVTATASGGTSSYGLNNEANSTGYIIYIDRSTFSGNTNSIKNFTGYTLRIGASKLVGGAVNAVGTYNCVGVYNGNTYTMLSATCQ
jgi:hypothetical protein